MKNFYNILKIIKIKFINIKYLGKKNKITFSKENNYDNMNIEFSKKLINASSDQDIQTFSEQVQNFLYVMDRDCKNFDPTLFLKNLKKTIFNIEDLKSDLELGRNGYVTHFPYEPIRFMVKTFKGTYHELSHLASIKKGKAYDSFLYEGYTQALAERYFNENVGKVYKIEVLLAKLIESIVGQDVMENLYYKGEFEKISNELTKYIGTKQLFVIFSSINFYVKLKKQNKRDIDAEIEILLRIFEYLFTGIKNKIHSRNYEIDEIQNLKEIWCKEIVYNIKDEIRSFSPINEDIFNNCFNISDMKKK